MADPFSVFTAGKVGERAIEESRFRRGLGLQQQQLGLQERQLGLQEQGQAQQFELQQAQEARLQAGQDLETAEGRREAGLRRIREIVGIEAFRRNQKETGQEIPELGSFLETQGGLKEALKFAKINKDQVELMILREQENQKIQQREATQQVIPGPSRLVEQPLGGGPVETIVPPVEQPAKPRTESEIRAAIDEKIVTGGLASLTPQETQLVSLDLAQNPLGQFALGTGQTLSELIGGEPPTPENPEGKSALSKRENDIVLNSIDDLSGGEADMAAIVAALEKNKELSDERKRAIAAAIAVGLFAQ